MTLQEIGLKQQQIFGCSVDQVNQIALVYSLECQKNFGRMVLDKEENLASLISHGIARGLWAGFNVSACSTS